MSEMELISTIDSNKIELACLKLKLEINQFAIVNARIGYGLSFFPKPLLKTLKFQRRTKNLGKHLRPAPSC